VQGGGGLATTPGQALVESVELEPRRPKTPATIQARDCHLEPQGMSRHVSHGVDGISGGTNATSERTRWAKRLKLNVMFPPKETCERFCLWLRVTMREVFVLSRITIRSHCLTRQLSECFALGVDHLWIFWMCLSSPGSD
jgi:hypothetical protein